jgi:hypothetical protein
MRAHGPEAKSSPHPVFMRRPDQKRNGSGETRTRNQCLKRALLYLRSNPSRASYVPIARTGSPIMWRRDRHRPAGEGSALVKAGALAPPARGEACGPPIDARPTSARAEGNSHARRTGRASSAATATLAREAAQWRATTTRGKRAPRLRRSAKLPGMRPLILCRERLDRILSILDRRGGELPVREFLRTFSVYEFEVTQAADLGWIAIDQRGLRESTARDQLRDSPGE